MDDGKGGPEDNVVHFPPGRCTLDGDLGIIRIFWGDMEGPVTLAHAKEQIVAMRRLIRDGTIPALVDMRHVKGTSREARDYYAGPDLAALVSACAMVIGGNRVAAVIGNFMFALHSERLVPMKLFVEETDAIPWLLAFKRAEGRPHRKENADSSP